MTQNILVYKIQLMKFPVLIIVKIKSLKVVNKYNNNKMLSITNTMFKTKIVKFNTAIKNLFYISQIQGLMKIVKRTAQIKIEYLRIIMSKII